MAFQQEIERKFLVVGDGWRGRAPGVLYRQGYIARTQDRVVRVRVAGDKGFLTVKIRSGTGLSRAEFEYAVPFEEAQAMLDEIMQEYSHVGSTANTAITDVICKLTDLRASLSRLGELEQKLGGRSHE